MATNIFPLNRSIGVSSYTGFATLSRGTISTTSTAITTAADMAIGYWTTKPLAGFTLSGTISLNAWGDEQNTATNYGIKCIVYKWNQSAGLSTAIATITSVEFAASPGAVTGSATPVSTVISDDDQLVFQFLFTPVGSGTASRTVNFYYNGPTAAAQGDTYITLTENITLSQRVTSTM